MSNKNAGLEYVYHVFCVVCAWRIPLLARYWKPARHEAYMQGWHQTKNGWMCPTDYRRYKDGA